VRALFFPGAHKSAFAFTYRQSPRANQQMPSWPTICGSQIPTNSVFLPLTYPPAASFRACSTSPTLALPRLKERPSKRWPVLG